MTFCALLPVTLGIFALCKMDVLIDIALNGTGVGRIKKTKQKVTVQTSEGVLKIPTAKFPNLDWEMYFIEEVTDVKDGINDLDNIMSLKMSKCKQFRDLVLCEYIYSTDFKRGDIKLAISSPLDDLCYVFTVKEGDVIDYKNNIEDFLKEIEEN